MSQQTPIYEALNKYRQEKGLRLHMPGHIGGLGLSITGWKELGGIDVTEIPGLDDLHLPGGIIAEAQILLARACGAHESFVLVNGATLGMQALFMSLNEKARVLVPRNAHRSFYAGMILSGIEPIYLSCTTDPEIGIVHAVTPETIEDELYLHSEVEAVFVTSPSYYGTCADIAGISSITDRWGKMLLVDEAHGAHFPFHPSYPHTALEDGAAAVVSGLHKTWPVLTQGACLHLGAGFKPRRRLRAAYDLLTTTSPSYPLLAAIDLARDFMEREGHNYLDRSLKLAHEFKDRLGKLAGIRCYGDDLLDMAGVTAVDPLKILIGVKGLSLNGYQLGQVLRREYQIQVEMTGEHYILAMFSLLHERADWERFYQAIRDTAVRFPAGQAKQKPVSLPPPWEVVMNPRQAFFAPKRKIRLAESRGEVAGEMVAVYPPGIPCLVPGERITEEIWNYLNYLQRSGAHIQGPEEADLQHIIIIEGEDEGD